MRSLRTTALFSSAAVVVCVIANIALDHHSAHADSTPQPLPITGPKAPAPSAPHLTLATPSPTPIATITPSPAPTSAPTPTATPVATATPKPLVCS